jgi:hypothetical protein
MKLAFVSLVIFLLALASCNKNKINIKRVVISFYNENNTLDSFVFKDKYEIKIINDFISTKIEVPKKFPVRYFLRIEYRDGEFYEI